MLVAQLVGLAEPEPVNDAGVVELVADGAVFLLEQHLKQPSIGIKATGIQDGVFPPMEGRDLAFKLFVNVLDLERQKDEKNQQINKQTCDTSYLPTPQQTPTKISMAGGLNLILEGEVCTCVPHMNRTELSPAPYSSMAFLPAAMTSG